MINSPLKKKKKKKLPYLCKVIFRLPVHALILFCASRWVIPSVLIPSMVRTTSPIPTCARAAFPPSLSWNATRRANGRLKYLMLIFSEQRKITYMMFGHKKWKKFEFLLYKLVFVDVAVYVPSFWWSIVYKFMFLFHVNDRKSIVWYYLFFKTTLLIDWMIAMHIHLERQAGIGS